MGSCCSTEVKYTGRRHEDDELEGNEVEEDVTTTGHAGAIVRLQGSSTYTSMYSRKGKKGINQDAMTVWENFMGEKNALLCAVFDGHGPSGHQVARHICDGLPFKLSTVRTMNKENDVAVGAGQSWDKEDMFSSWEESVIRAFEESDEDLMSEESFDSYCSGTTAITIIKKDEHLIISNLGDSRAILCTRDDENQLVPVQLTVDLKPSVPSEAERILKCGGRVFAMDEEPNVPRVWMSNRDCPGLAMSRAFGDFCLKNHGVIAVPEVSYRKLTSRDEFVVLATDGVWDVLTNNKVIRIVGSVKKQSMVAKILVYYAVQGWRTKYPGSKVDDCSVICLFLKKRPLITTSLSDTTEDLASQIDVADSNIISKDRKTEEGETVINCDITVDSKDLGELNRVNSHTKSSRLGNLNRRKTSRDCLGAEAN